MTDTSTDLLAGKKRRGPQPRRRIVLPNDKTLQPRVEFADEIGVTDRTCARMNLPTTYIGNVAYVEREESLGIIAGRIRRPNQPPPKRRGGRGEIAAPRSQRRMGRRAR
jgi:hypothetical protein